MNASELEEILVGTTETQRIEFKGSCSWDERIFAKDILALTNVQDGGLIVVGVKDGTFEREGITQTQQTSFNLDTMRDQMAKFADPHVNFTVEFPQDSQNRTYAVIRVNQFVEVPVICRVDSVDTRKGVIYYRNRDRRAESAAVSNSYDMRDIIEMAVVRMMRRKIDLGWKTTPGAKDLLDAELEGL